MRDTKIRWANHTWNAFTGCTKISPGCDNCYAETIAEKFRGTAFPNGFDPTFKPNKLNEPSKWRTPSRVFVNSMSDMHHVAFTREQVDAVYDRMPTFPQHDFLVLTKRPGRMASYFLGDERTGEQGWLARHGFDRVPDNIWLGTTIESNEFVSRADQLRRIPVTVRFLSCEPLIGPLPDLDLAGIGWVICGGESGKGYRPMPHEWAADLRDASREAGAAFYFKQSAAPRTEMGQELEGKRHEEYPFAHPELGHPRVLGIWRDGEPDDDQEVLW